MDYESNPLKAPELKEFENNVLQPAEIPWKLTGIKLTTGTKYKSEEVEDKLLWKFRAVDVKPYAYCSVRTSTSTWARRGNEGGAVKMLQRMAPSEVLKLPREKNERGKDQKDVIEPEAMWALCKKQVGQIFLMATEPSECMQYNNFVSLRPNDPNYVPPQDEDEEDEAGDAQSPLKLPPRQQRVKEIRQDFEDDDIPF